MICTANQITGFYMKVTLALNGLKSAIKILERRLVNILIILGAAWGIYYEYILCHKAKSNNNFPMVLPDLMMLKSKGITHWNSQELRLTKV